MRYKIRITMTSWSSSLLIGLVWLISTIQFEHISAIRTYNENRLAQLRDEVKSMFYHAYDSYIQHAYPFDELRPLSCDGVDTWGSYSLTLIDTLDTLAVMGNYSEFRRVAQLIIDNAHFDMNINVSVFETNIRIIGGLLSAHLLSHKAGMEVEKGWPCNGPLLRLAEKVARKLLPAFDTNTGMPYGTVNLRYGVPPKETPITCTAGAGTFIVEFGTLSRLTGDPVYEKVALRAMHALFSRRSALDLFGNHIDTQTGKWTAVDSGIGAGVDSYFEYMVKGAILFQKPELMHMFRTSFRGIEKHLGKNGWYVWATMGQGHVSSTTFQSLESYWPGLLSLVGEFKTGLKAIMNYHRIWKQYGALPELYNIIHGKASHQREGYPLRPELIESAMYLYRATGDPYMLEIGEDMLRGIAYNAKTECGFATIRDVTTLTLEDRMESFFLAETIKYLYLVFDPDNFIHSEGDDYTVIDNPHGKCTLYAGGYIFNTEAHPIDPSALHCCTGVRDSELHEEVAVIDEIRLSQPFHGKRSIDNDGEVNILKLSEPEDIPPWKVAEDEDRRRRQVDATSNNNHNNNQKSGGKNKKDSPSDVNIEDGDAKKSKSKNSGSCKKKNKERDGASNNDNNDIADVDENSEETCYDDEEEEHQNDHVEENNMKEDEAETQSLLERLLKKLFEEQEVSNQNQNNNNVKSPNNQELSSGEGLSSESQRTDKIAQTLETIENNNNSNDYKQVDGVKPEIPTSQVQEPVSGLKTKGKGTIAKLTGSSKVLTKPKSSENRIKSRGSGSYSGDNSQGSDDGSEPDLDLIFGTKGPGQSLSFYFSLKWLGKFPELIRQVIPSERFDLQAFYKKLSERYTNEMFSRDFNFSLTWTENYRVLKCPDIEFSDRFMFFKSSVDS